MPQKIYFYKAKIFSEEVTQGFSRENVYESIKSLLKGSDSHAAEFIEKYFEVINIDYIRISYRAIEEINPSFSNKLNCIFNPDFSQFFMIESEIWSTLEKIVEQLIMNNLSQKNEEETTDILKENYEISREYVLLSELFNKKLLFGNIF